MSVSYALLPNTINLPSKVSDQYALHYFFTHTALDLSNNMPDSFWDIVVLQACRRNVVVQQAVIAVGQLHLQHSLDDKSRLTTILSYHKAIILLRKYPSHNSDPSSIVKLICCILNFTCERLLGNEDASHLFRGRAIQRAETRRERATSHLDTIRRMLSMLHLEHSIKTWFRNRAAASAGHELGDGGVVSISALKPDFYTLEDAREQLAAIGFRGLRYLEEQWYYRE